MLRVTRWCPDTCGCVLEYEWDDAEDENTRKHTLKAIIRRCPYHSLATDQDVYKEVLLENTMKNTAFAEAEKIIPSITPENYKWSFDEGRKLKVELIDIPLSGLQKQRLRDALDAKCGAGKVEVV